jgi:hypothetical protein
LRLITKPGPTLASSVMPVSEDVDVVVSVDVVSVVPVADSLSPPPQPAAARASVARPTTIPMLVRVT